MMTTVTEDGENIFQTVLCTDEQCSKFIKYWQGSFTKIQCLAL